MMKFYNLIQISETSGVVVVKVSSFSNSFMYFETKKYYIDILIVVELIFNLLISLLHTYRICSFNFSMNNQMTLLVTFTSNVCVTEQFLYNKFIFITK